jgi:hypothetical protein
MTSEDRMKELGWGGVVKTSMTIHDVPFKNNPQEVVPTEEELNTLRDGFDSWMERQTGTIPL